MTAPTLAMRTYSVPIPERMRALPVDPRTRHLVPWFVAQLDDGSYDFRAIGGELVDGRMVTKVDTAPLFNKCWLCGQWMSGGDKWFAVGPMCLVNRTTSEPPGHHECMQFAMQTCPFIVHPRAVRREANMPEGHRPPGGFMIPRNPGVMLLWHTRRFERFPDGHGGKLFDIGEALGWEWWAEGRAATRAEVLASIESGMPLLRAKCDEESTPARCRDAHAALDKQFETAQPYLPYPTIPTIGVNA